MANRFIISTMALILFISCEKEGVKITEEIRTLITYPFSEPNPIPMLAKDKRLYPYHAFLGYSREGTPQDWKMIKMENEHIEVYVSPETGGKVWGAVDKSNGKEFIYRNEVMKFRNISLRGPWTSGGIEFNFGVIGHTPATATPVDYTTRTNPDGSVSTFVGSMDLPSRTHWRVEIRVEPGRANFETKAMWYNPTPSTQAYYNWMTAAAFAQDDLEMIFPGDRFLKHSGEVLPWPIDDKNRNLTYYGNNRFEGHKSYHVVGAWKNFFGGYYHKDGYGFGHWARQDEMPGQKLWLWALSQQGGIWEDHLTDTDGQYIEFQAGRQLVQYSPGNHENPIRKAGFDPYGTDRWTESWFPVGEIGGMVDASQNGVMNVEIANGQIEIKLHAFITITGTVDVVSNRQIIHSESLLFTPREVQSLTLDHRGEFEVIVAELDLHYQSDSKVNTLDRSYKLNQEVMDALPELDRQYFQGNEYLKERKYDLAEDLFLSVLESNPHHLDANKGMADLYFRKGMIWEGLNSIRKNLTVNSYDADANFIGGNLYRAKGKYIDAREAFGWAARSMAYRSAGFTQMAEIYLIENNWDQAINYAKQALDYNRYNMNALQVLVIANRKLGYTAAVKKWIDQLLWMDPLHHFANLELVFIDPSDSNSDRFHGLIQNEFPEQTYLELAISYFNRGLKEEAIAVLKGPSASHPMLSIWMAYLTNDRAMLEKAASISPDFVNPFRRESIDVLQWAVTHNNHWRLKYYLALNYWAKNRKEESLFLMNGLGGIPGYGPFYAARAAFRKSMNRNGVAPDLDRSIMFSPDAWPITLNVIQYYQTNGDWTEALALSSKAMTRFPNNFNVEIMHAKSLLYNNRLDECITVLDGAKVLPSEMARESRQLFEWAHLAKAVDFLGIGNKKEAEAQIELSREWPPHLGIGKPYEPDERLQKVLQKYINNEIGSDAFSDALKKLKNKKSKTDYHSILIDAVLRLIQI
ncbi:MAG: DUF5107 domain-containing protein [Candidatus Marinimicrobia bacterium]|nr:DUF5107 domain-containing protein [Candidatus Neomarinimicrobiota bacterium]